MKKECIPNHVAIIMDGNGRWAQKRGYPRNLGHRKGAQTLSKIVKYANKLNIKYLTVYAFSTENWKRPKEEVNYLMDLPVKFFKKYGNDFLEEGIRVKVIGHRAELSEELNNIIDEIEGKTKNNKGLTFVIALNYGGMDEIVDAINYLVANKIQITKEEFPKYLYTKDVPSVDLLIRTSGEVRISNFLLWQIAYSELYFTDILWPDFNQKAFDEALKSYERRDRRFGGIK